MAFFNKQRLTIISLVLLTFCVLTWALGHYANITLFTGKPFLALRWLTGLSLIGLAIRRKSLTFWILVSMAIGIEAGYTFPEFSLKLKVLSDIFLRLIKTNYFIWLIYLRQNL